MRSASLANRLALSVSLIISLIILAISILFTAGLYLTVENSVRRSITSATDFIIKNHVVYVDGQIRYIRGDDADTISDEFRSHDLSALIFDANLARVGTYGIFGSLINSGKFAPSKENQPLKSVLASAKPLFAGTTLLDGRRYDRYFTPLTFGGQVVGVVEIAKQTELADSLIRLSFIVMAVIIPISIAVSWLAVYFLTRRSLKPLADLINQLKQITAESFPQDFIVDHQGLAEITALETSINTMLERIKDGVEKQKQFIANASHELKTPLAQAVSTLDVLLAQSPSNPASPKIQSIKYQLLHLSQTLDSLLVLSRLTAAKSSPSVKPVPLYPLLARLAADYQPTLASIPISLTIECPSNLPISIKPEHGRILIENILTNAIKYSRPATTINIVAADNQGQTQITIQDQGQGMSADEVKHIFDRFYRGQNTRHRPGFGLGMAIVKSICDLYRITITVNSQPNQGTLVSLTFPK